MPCCKDCTKRVLGCHSHCKEYIEEKEELRKRTEEIQKQRRYQSEVIRVLQRDAKVARMPKKMYRYTKGGTTKWHK